MYLGGAAQLCCKAGTGKNRLLALRGDHDWAKLMADIRQQCDAGLYQIFEILSVSSWLGFQEL